MARRYGTELHGYHLEALAALGDIEQSRGTYDSLVGAERVDEAA